MLRRYSFKLYPTPSQAAALREQCGMVALLWNTLLERHEEIQRRTRQVSVWIDAQGKRHIGRSSHRQAWESVRNKNGDRVVMIPSTVDDKIEYRPVVVTTHEEYDQAIRGIYPGTVKPYTRFDMTNEITHLVNELPEWRALSVWVPHRTAVALDEAFKAFYRRLKELSDPAVYETRAAEYLRRRPVRRDGTPTRKPSRFRLAGYPRFKQGDRHHGVPHRFASGCKLVKDERHALSWKLYLKGIAGPIHARGRFPSPEHYVHDGSRRSRPQLAITDWTHADVIWRDSHWEVSVAVDLPDRRQNGSPFRQPLTIRFDLLDEFALVNGLPESPPNFARIFWLTEDRAEQQALHDQQWPRGKRVPEGEKELHEQSLSNMSKLSTFIARARRDSLHVWTDRVVRRASDLTIIMPDLRAEVRTPRGNERQWGASVETVSDLNQHVLSMAAGMAVQMLTYKAEEAGISCHVVIDTKPNTMIGRHLVGAGKAARQLRREIKRGEAA